MRENRRSKETGGFVTVGWSLETHFGILKQGGTKHSTISASHLLFIGQAEFLQTSISFPLTVLLTQPPIYSQSSKVLHLIPIATQLPTQLATSQTETFKDIQFVSNNRKQTWILGAWRIACFLYRNTGWLR